MISMQRSANAQQSVRPPHVSVASAASVFTFHNLRLLSKKRGDRQPPITLLDLSPTPTAGYCSEYGYDCPNLVISAEHPITAEMVEITAISQTQGPDAAAHRGTQLLGNRQRRQQHHDRKRYAAIALARNLRLSAEKLAEP
jgi:hypothetical protein